MRSSGGRSRPAARLGLLALAAVPVLAAGCASTPAGRPSAQASAAAQYASDSPPAAARMICGEEIRGEIADALGLASVPARRPTWADHVYGCSYAPPMGQLSLSVTVTPSDTAAAQRLAAVRGQLQPTDPEPGLGTEAWSTPAGVLVARKDNMVLRVDATGLPDDLGATHERRVDLARVIAAGVFNCWTGSS